MALRHTIAGIPVVGRVALGGYRLRQAGPYIASDLRALAKWLVTSRETTNFTYELEPLNQEYLAQFVAHVASAPLDVVLRYMQELTDDEELRRHVRACASVSPERYMWDGEARYARRYGWYALIRALKPRVVVETGVDKGLGSCVVAAALIRNGAEGQAGRYYGTEIKRAKGFLFREPYAKVGTILYGDSVTTLRAFAEPIDLFINDSDHAVEYEAAEYQAVADKLSERAVVIGDNAHCNDELLKFARATGRDFLFFAERPRDHWFPGAGLGVAFPKQRSTDGIERVREASGA
jgi:predicted O-methyltransferase YrrM